MSIKPEWKPLPLPEPMATQAREAAARVNLFWPTVSPLWECMACHKQWRGAGLPAEHVCPMLPENKIP